MVKSKKNAALGERRTSTRLANKPAKPVQAEKKKAVKKAAKPKKTKAENGGAKAQEAKTDATEAK